MIFPKQFSNKEQVQPSAQKETIAYAYICLKLLFVEKGKLTAS